MDAAGNFVVSWNSVQQDGSGYGVYMQRYNAAGVAQGDETRVNTHTPLSQSAPTIALDAAGNIVVVWQCTDQDGSFQGVYAQRDNSAGVAQQSEFRVNSSTTNSQLQPAVAMNLAGDFVIAWASYANGVDADIEGAALHGCRRQSGPDRQVDRPRRPVEHSRCRQRIVHRHVQRGCDRCRLDRFHSGP